MPHVTFRTADGVTQVVDAPVGDTVMEVAVAHAVAGILGECGGSATCGTCHVWLDMDTINDPAALPTLGFREDDVLDGTSSERRESSRLACQIMITDSLDGLCLDVPGEDW